MAGRVLSAALALMLAGTAVQAQVVMPVRPAPPAPPPTPADPLLLPSDAAPPPMARMLAPPAPPAPGQLPGVGVPDTTPALPMALAVDLAEAAIAACTAQGLRVGAAVSDAAGNLRVGITGDSARAGRIFTASRKNAAVIAYGLPTSEINAKLRADPAAVAAVKPNMAVMAGGIPVYSGGKIIAALAVSGATSAQDEDCARKAVEALKARLP